jgi:hypothetical protein
VKVAFAANNPKPLPDGRGHVRDTGYRGATVWEGVVHVFDLEGHPKATRSDAWSSPIEGSDKRRFFAVLHMPPVTSPVEAVRAAIVAERKAET